MPNARIALRLGKLILICREVDDYELVTVTSAGPYTVRYKKENGIQFCIDWTLFLKQAYRARDERAPESAKKYKVRIVRPI